MKGNTFLHLVLTLFCNNNSWCIGLENVLDMHINKLIARNVEEILSQLGDIEKRYNSLGEDDESRLEKIVLNHMRKILLDDLRQITGFSSYYGYDIRVEPSVSLENSEAIT